MGVSFIDVDARTAEYASGENHVPKVCFRGTCWHAAYRAGQRAVGLHAAGLERDLAQAHYAQELGYFVLALLLVALLAFILFVLLPVLQE